MTFGDWRRAVRDRGADAADRGDVVLLDEHGVEQADAVILAAAAADGVLLREAQARQCLARIEDARARAGDDLDECARRRCGARERLEEVQRRALAGDDAARRPAKLADDGVRRYRSAVRGAPVDGDSRIQLPKRLVEPRAAAQCRGLARDDARDRARVGRDQLRREIAVAEIFRDRAAHDSCDIRWEGRRGHA